MFLPMSSLFADGIVDSTGPASSSGSSNPAIMIIIVFAAMAAGIYFLMKLAKKKRMDAASLAAEPVYTKADGSVIMAAGWYATADGAQDRYHDGMGWTDEHRSHAESSMATDPSIQSHATDWEDRLSEAEVTTYQDEMGYLTPDVPVEASSSDGGNSSDS